MTVTASQLRGNIYRLLDDVAKTGQPLLVKRRGHVLKIVAATTRSKVDQLRKRHCIEGDPESLVHVDWSTEWRP